MELSEARCYRRKYHLLRKHCDRLQRVNERMLSRIYNVKRITRRYKRDRQRLIQSLDERADSWRDIEVPAFWEEGNVYRMMIENPSGPPGWHHQSSEAVGGPYSMTVEAATQSSIGSTQAHEAPPESQRKVKRKVRDENAPKRPINAYFMYCSEKRHDVQDQYWDETGREITRHELTRVMAIKWNQLTVEEKKVYYDKYEQSKAIYEEQMKKYKEECAAKEAKIAAESAPLRPLTDRSTLLPTNLDDGLEPFQYQMTGQHVTPNQLATHATSNQLSNQLPSHNQNHRFAASRAFDFGGANSVQMTTSPHASAAVHNLIQQGQVLLPSQAMHHPQVHHQQNQFEHHSAIPSQPLSNQLIHNLPPVTTQQQPPPISNEDAALLSQVLQGQLPDQLPTSELIRLLTLTNEHAFPPSN